MKIWAGQIKVGWLVGWLDVSLSDIQRGDNEKEGGRENKGCWTMNKRKPLLPDCTMKGERDDEKEEVVVCRDG